MTLSVKVSNRAASHIRQAAEWWEQNRPAAPGAVRKDIGEALALLATQPGIGAAYQGAKTKDVRRLLVGRIRYFIYYRPTRETLEVLAVWHISRGKQPLV
jgi:plasmid stabilization system protein ParE